MSNTNKIDDMYMKCVVFFDRYNPGEMVHREIEDYIMNELKEM